VIAVFIMQYSFLGREFDSQRTMCACIFSGSVCLDMRLDTLHTKRSNVFYVPDNTHACNSGDLCSSATPKSSKIREKVFKHET
jgi:hypothetical protein